MKTFGYKEAIDKLLELSFTLQEANRFLWAENTEKIMIFEEVIKRVKDKEAKDELRKCSKKSV